MRVKRIEQIEDYINLHKTVTIDNLCEVFHVSRNTIRRDLDTLSAKGVVNKIYGGVTSNKTQETIPFEERNIKNMDMKNRIARKAAEFIDNDDTLFIDSGTTATTLFNQLSEKKRLTLFTNNLEIVVKSIYANDFHVVSTGGALARNTYSTVGPDAARLLERYNIKKAFMSATGLSIGSGLTNSSQGEYEVKKAIISRCHKVYMLIDSSKFGDVSLMTFGRIEDADVIITDKAPSQEYLDYFREHGVELVIAD
ncbi:DeoR/GlpR family DNA-binding transcription regulator [Youxingia wuxianensis]|uniref:DeoR/GlpR transcriptional regulator n=1 Tax=Youxingia wuxianensis TaxID=2763678 RepID=A0A926EQR8_9FIRM|nr:DeoR/GlpR family DNA-binding transcription regulator [Youxingia wuxianensis]MBC8585692.1 DeoR/GlpR transcriptional regulator [Youxingia wuxianensis]